MRMLLAPGPYMLASLVLLLWRLARSLVNLLWRLLCASGTQINRGIRWGWQRTTYFRAAPSEPDRTVVPFQRRR